MKHQRGVSLLEILLVLGIIASILLMTTWYFSETGFEMRVMQSIQEMQSITQAAYRWQSFQKQTDFSGVSLQALIDDGLVVNQSHTPWGGAITVSADEDAPEHVRITLSNIPSGACKMLRHKMTDIVTEQASDEDCATHTYYGVF